MTVAQEEKQAIHIGLTVEEASSPLRVKVVERFSSAAKAGIQVGDQILSFDGVQGSRWDQLLAVADRAGVGQVVNVRLVRDGAELELPMRLKAFKSVKLEIKAIDEVLERKISP
jgi:S1-C subfamily serine protease